MAAVRAKKSARQADGDVFVMEARLKLLKEQMEVERKKREDMLSKNGTGSIWMNGRAGAMRGVRDVRALVRTNARERQARPTSGTSATSAADTETRSPTEQLDDRPWTPGPDNANWTPAQREADGVAHGNDDSALARPTTAPVPVQVQVAAMECQTEPVASGRPLWSGNRSASGDKPGGRATKRAVATTYLAKILQVRKEQQQKQQP